MAVAQIASCIAFCIAFRASIQAQFNANQLSDVLDTSLTHLSPEVLAAMDNGVPLVALESTIITHGMPYPQNLETAILVENEIRQHNAVPATIAIIDGRLRIGLDLPQLEHLAQANDVLKLSRADLAFALSSGRTGSTTVAATMIAANLAGIRIFATGGIGGVHRGAEKTWDISADLPELSQTPVTVVCAGAKAILDLPRTLEYLETAGVPVVVYGSDELPAFWSRTSGLAAPLRMDDVTQINHFRAIRDKLQLRGGVLIANPIPKAAEISQATVQSFIDEALVAASKQNIKGKAVTPFLLDKINQLSGGQSLQSNIALIRHNAALSARIAVDAADQ